MKAAMYSIAGNIMRKEKVPENTSTVLCMTEEEQPVMAEPEQVYWDGNRWTGPPRRPNPPTYKTFQGGQPPQPSLARGYGYQNQRGWRNNSYNQPYKNRGGWRDNRNQSPPFPGRDRNRRAFQEWYEDAQGNFYEAGEEGTPDGGEVPELIMYSGQEHQNHIILDTRRKYNMMGTKGREVLHRR